MCGARLWEANIAIWQPDRRELLVAGTSLLGAAGLATPGLASGSPNLRLFVLGDWGRDGSHYQRHVARWMDYEARRSGCDLVVTTGDNFYIYGVGSVDDRQWRTSYEEIYSPQMRQRPWFPVAGNHDWGGSLWAQLDRTGRDGWHMPWLWYDIPGTRFGRPDLHFFFIDTTVWRGREKKLFRLCGQSIRGKDTERQKVWLSNALRESCAPTKIVFGHHPIFQTNEEGGAKSRALADLDSLLIENNVTAYVCGHKHCLYHIRTDRLDYICSGGGSEERLRDTRSGFDPANFPADPSPRLERFVGMAGFAVLDIGTGGFRCTFIDRDGRAASRSEVASKGNHALGCSGGLILDPAVERRRRHAVGKTYLPCGG